MLQLEPLTQRSVNVDSISKEQETSKKVLRQLIIQYKQEWTEQNKSPQNKNKIPVRTLQTKFEMEQYLNTVKHQAYRKAITKLRLGTHDLRIQKGKYENNGGPIPVEQGICKRCSLNQVENEHHSIGNCIKYIDTRNTYFNQISAIDDIFAKLDINDKITYILEAKYPTTSTLIGKYLYHISKYIVNTL